MWLFSHNTDAADPLDIGNFRALWFKQVMTSLFLTNDVINDGLLYTLISFSFLLLLLFNYIFEPLINVTGTKK